MGLAAATARYIRATCQAKSSSCGAGPAAPARRATRTAGGVATAARTRQTARCPLTRAAPQTRASPRARPAAAGRAGSSAHGARHGGCAPGARAHTGPFAAPGSTCAPRA